MFATLREDIRTIYRKDPAARNIWEVFTYAGLWAIVNHRVAHWLWGRKRTTLARVLSQWSRFSTGIEIHPAATIGRRFFIDHGAAVVIGETSIIGDDVLMYHQVTLGGTSTDRVKRHPTIGSGVMLGMGASIIGNIVVGDNARVGANAVVTKDVPAGATAVGNPARLIRQDGIHISNQPTAQVMDMALGSVDPMGELMRRTIEELEITKARLADLESRLQAHTSNHNGDTSVDDHLLDELDEMCDPRNGKHAPVTQRDLGPSTADFLPGG